MQKVIDLTGKRFGRLTVLNRAENHGIHPSWHCRCDCGKETKVAGQHLRNGTTKSCGCLRIKHQLSYTLIYRSWRNMLSRCENPHDPNFSLYGGRGIKVCPQWHDIQAFREDMGDRPSPQYTIDRIDNNGNYDPGNCHWATSKEQSRNRRDNHLITFQGETRCQSEWAESLGISRQRLDYRLRVAGWTTEKALTISSQRQV